MTDELKVNTVLVVDDMPSSCDIVRSLFEGVGVEVVGTAENGLVALDKMDELRPDLVCLDIIMPVMDGIECYRHIEAHNSRNPQAAVSALFISCLANELKFIDYYKDQIPAKLFLPKYPDEASLRAAIAFAAESPPKPLQIASESASSEEDAI